MQRKKREMGKKKGLVVIKPRVRRTLSVGILISIFAKYLPGKMKIFRGNTEELVFGVSNQFFLPYFISYTIVMHTIEDSLYR